jgi:hypothetical protein
MGKNAALVGHEYCGVFNVVVLRKIIVIGFSREGRVE